MIEITAEIRAFIDKAAAGVELAEDEYIDPSDGLIHCKKCGSQRQTVLPCFGKSGYFMPRCIGQCQREAEEQRKAADVYKRQLYSNILLKLYLKSLKHGGRLQLDEDSPYTAQMLATITRQDVYKRQRSTPFCWQL